MKNIAMQCCAGLLIMLGMVPTAHAQTVTAYRYWFDDAGATVVTTPVSGGASFTLGAVDASALSAGYHRVTLQFRDSDNQWGVPVTSNFYRNGGDLTEHQYWFDDDVSTLAQTTVSPTSLLQVVTLIDAGALAQGAHTITVRTRDEQDVFSVPVTYGFDMFTGMAELPGVERLVLFPNPATEQLYLTVDAAAPLAVQATLLDAQGRQVASTTTTRITGAGTITFETTALAPGVYHLRLQGSGGTTDLPFTKQ